jgi:hypothetical protein
MDSESSWRLIEKMAMAVSTRKPDLANAMEDSIIKLRKKEMEDKN